MNALGAKLLVVFLSGVIALPVGFCCQLPVEHGPGPVNSGHCCRKSEQPSAPVKAVKSCCCQKRVNSSAVAKPGKRLPGMFLPAVASPAKLRLSNIGKLHFRPFPVGHSFQAVYCVWRC